MPEQLKPAQDLKTVKSDLKKTARELTKMDAKRKRLPPTTWAVTDA
jgi:hypothetical protein